MWGIPLISGKKEAGRKCGGYPSYLMTKRGLTLRLVRKEAGNPKPLIQKKTPSVSLRQLARRIITLNNPDNSYHLPPITYPQSYTPLQCRTSAGLSLHYGHRPIPTHPHTYPHTCSYTTKAAVANLSPSHRTTAALSDGSMYTSTHSERTYVGTSYRSPARSTAAPEEHARMASPCMAAS